MASRRFAGSRFAFSRETKKMPHYEVIAIIHPDQHARSGEMADRYKKIISDGGGIIHRFEDWGLRPLAYPMKKQRRAQYILLNIECKPETLGELQENFRFSDAVMRSLVVRCDEAISEDSPMKKKIEEEKLAEAESKARAESERKAAEAEAKAKAEKAADKAEDDKAANGKDAKDGKDNKDAKDAKDDNGEDKDIDAKVKKPSRKEKKAAAENDEDEGDSSIKAPRKSAAKSRRVSAQDNNEDDNGDEE